MAASLSLFHVFFEDLVAGVHDFTPTTGNSFFVYLSNEAPLQSSDELKADIAEIAPGNGYTTGGNELVIQQVSQVAGTCRVIALDPDAWTASGGAITAFRYAILYNGSTTKKTDPLIGYWDNGSTVNLADGDSFSVDTDLSSGIIVLSQQMAISTAISQRELERVAQVAFEGKYLRVSLASLSSQGYTSESTVASWDSIKLSGNGYADFIVEIEAGAYDTADARYETPQITAQFSASAEGAGLNYNRIYTVIATPSAATIESASLTDNVATVITAANHGFAAGKTVIIEGFSNAVFNGTYTIATTPAPDSFTFARQNTNIGTVTSGGTATELTDSAYLHSLITESPAVILAPSQTVSYRIQVCTDD